MTPVCVVHSIGRKLIQCSSVVNFGMEYSNDELLSLYNCYILSCRNSEFAQRLYHNQYPGHRIPNQQEFENVHRNLCETGTLRGIRNLSEENLHTKLRLDFCMWLVSQHRTDANFAQNILFTDEKEFKGDGICHSFSLNIWAGVMGNILIGPIFLPTRLNGHQYCDFLKENLPIALRDIPIERRQSMWFMHDGATPHATNRVQELLNSADYFPRRWIGKGGEIPWPANSPDLNPMDFYVWKTINNYIDEDQNRIESLRTIQTSTDYMQQIYDAFDRFRSDENNFRQIEMMTDIRIQGCILENGGDFKSLIRRILR